LVLSRLRAFGKSIFLLWCPRCVLLTARARSNMSFNYSGLFLCLRCWETIFLTLGALLCCPRCVLLTARARSNINVDYSGLFLCLHCWETIFLTSGAPSVLLTAPARSNMSFNYVGLSRVSKPPKRRDFDMCFTVVLFFTLSATCTKQAEATFSRS
jgi:hypothetical protein